uniref:Dirigent protein n=3 Tax=Setaria italica TaxID=4555 RepID=K3Z295_SETIT
ITHSLSPLTGNTSLPLAMASYTIDSVQSELKMTLYIKEVYDGPDTNGVTIISRAKMGTTWVFSWLVTDGPGPDANIVGHMQGTSVQVANTPDVYQYSLGLVFGDKRFNGSTLQISGTSQINGEWSIVGGTGELAMAKGTIKRTEIRYIGNTRISELKIHAFYTPMNSTTVSSNNTGCKFQKA